jgi:hypothetical protein
MNRAYATHKFDQWEAEAWDEFVASAAEHGINLNDICGPSPLMEILRAAVTSGLSSGIHAAQRHIDGTG